MRTILVRARWATARATCTRTTSTTASSRSGTHRIRWRTARTTSRQEMVLKPASPIAPNGSGLSCAGLRRSRHDADGPVMAVLAMNVAELAALIAAVFFALLVCAGVFVLFRLGRFLSESSRPGRPPAGPHRVRHGQHGRA